MKSLTKSEITLEILESFVYLEDFEISYASSPSGKPLGFHRDLSTIMHDNTDDIHKAFPKGTFRRLFWDQQIKNMKNSDPRQYRWHPLMIKWCLNLKLIPTASYHAMQSSGFITLPSERTLRDYTNYIKCKPDYQQ